MNLQENIRRILEMMNEIDLNQNSQRGGVDAILVGGLDNRKNKKGKLIDKTTEEQLAIFKQGFSGGNVKVFRWATPAQDILNYLKSYPKIPIFLFSAGCNLADELIVSKLVDKNKLYIIEPYNGNGLNSNVSKAIELGLNPKNIFVGVGFPGRGDGFSGASSSGANGHWEALRTVPKKLNY